MIRIMVPTDFSPNATKAIEYAVQLAKTGKASLMIINTCDHLTNVGLEAGLPMNDYNKQITDDAFANLDLISKSIKEAEHVDVQTELYTGTVVDSVVEAAKENGIQYIVMGTMGINSIRDSLFGTNTSGVIANATTPVIAIPPEYEGKPPAKMALAINHFDEVSGLLDPLFELARFHSSEVHLMVFTDEEISTSADFVADHKSIREAEEKLRGLYPDIVLKAEHISGKDFESAVMQYVDTAGIDLVAMTTHKRSLLGNIFNRSMTRKMSYHTRIPLLAIPVN